jgi:catechol 2,3-dioxygenase-like lactoylglutathione lyase family enzyme
MRSFFLFVAGLLVGLAIELAVQTSIAQSLTPNRGIVAMNHVGIIVPNLEQAVEYYTKTLGFPEAFRNKDANGNTTLVYVQISRETFVELQPVGPDRPAGISHFGIVVNDMKQATEMFKQRGAKVDEIRLSGTKAILSNVHDPVGNRMELLELPPDSFHAQAVARWR